VANGQLIAGQSYGYDPAGNITSLGDQIDPAYSRAFGYDGLNRLVTATSGAALWGNGAFTYDAMGNMQTMTIGSRVTQFSYQGATPKLSTVDGQVVVYDPAGNEIDSWSTGQPGVRLLRDYSARNRLAAATEVSGTGTLRKEFTYDGRGLRMVSTII
jgi:hypothetical protein